ncbi:MAG: HDOD domain-containing protein, partial [Acidobacteriota bacterium]
KNIVLTIEIFEGLATGRRATVMQNEALLRAYAMRELMGRTPQVEQGFIAGILADVGRLLLISKLPADSEIIEKKIEASVLPWVAEIDRLGCTSADIGGQLLTKWNLPPPLIEAVSQRHRPPPPEPTASVTTALMLVNAVEWSVRAPKHHRAEFEERALRLIGVFPGSTIESLSRYFGTTDESSEKS